MIKFNAPKDRYDKFRLNSKNPAIQKMVIDTFKSNGINVYKNTVEYDPEFPYLYWDGDELTQSHGTENLLSLEKFMAKFIAKESIEVKLNESYTAIVDEDGVRVGCQSFPHSVIEKLAEAVKKIKNQ